MAKLKMTKKQFLEALMLHVPCPEGLARFKRLLKTGTLLSVLKRYQKAEMDRQEIAKRLLKAAQQSPLRVQTENSTGSGPPFRTRQLAADWRWLVNKQSTLSEFLLSHDLVWVNRYYPHLTTTTKPE